MAAFVRLLGAPAVRHNDGWLELPVGKTSALLYYLAYQGGWVGRDDLLYLFWPDSPEHSARQNLRPLLSKLRQNAYVQGLESDKTRLRWQVQSDVQLFREALSSQCWGEAWQSYQGELLEGFNPQALPEFESWLALERGELHNAWREGALAFAAELEATNRHAEAAEVLAKLHRSDPFDEEALRRLLLALQAKGERSKALQVYASFAKTLRDELGGEPEPGTRALIARIERGEALEPQAAIAVHPLAARRKDRSMPLPATPFVGRHSEIATLAAKLADPACRLVTIVGPGGIGKTRLAIEVATEHQTAFRDGACFVPFEAVMAAEFMVPTLASALDFSFFGRREPKAQLLEYLQDKEVLLVLDNLEHLLAGTGLIAELLEAAANVKILATSRERLNLHAEWVFDLGGMRYPEAASPLPSPAALLQGTAAYDAATLFLQAAKRSKADFAPAEADLRAIARICQLVEGMPLALELAASWLRLLSVEEIASQLEGGLELLAAETRDVPARHRSVRAVFEHAWTLLLPREREALRKLSVFQGGFTLEAADAVADVGLPLLLALVNKSFVRRSPDGRFTQHPLLWQFVTERAKAHPEERAQTEEQHGAFFIAFLHRREKALHTPDERAAAKEIEADLDNAEAAWRWAAEHGREEWLDRALGRLCWFYFSRGWLERGLAVMRLAQGCPREDSVLHGRLLQWTGAFTYHGTALEEGRELFERSASIFERHGAKGPLAFAFRGIGATYGTLGGTYYQRSIEAFRRALELYRELDDAEGISMMLMPPAYHTKDPAEAERYLTEGVSRAREAGLSRPLAMILDSVAELHLYRTGDYPAAKAAMEECLARFADTGELLYRVAATGLYLSTLVQCGEDEAADRQARELLELAETLEPRLAIQLKPDALTALGHLAYLRGALEDARTFAQEARDLGASSLQRHGFGPLEVLARVALAQAQADEAKGWLDEAWQRLQPHPMRGSFCLTAERLSCLTCMADVAALRGDEPEAERYFREALSLARAWSYVPAALEALVGLANLYLHRHHDERAATLLDLAAGHPASTRLTKQVARRLLTSLAPGLELEPSVNQQHVFAVVDEVLLELAAR